MLAAALFCVFFSATPASSQPARPPSEGAVWSVRLRSAYLRQDIDDMILSLTMIARTDPALLRPLGQSLVLYLVREALQSARRDAGFELLQALFDAQWKLRYLGEPSTLWRDLTAMLIERDDLTRARLVAQRITDPHALIGMHADRRFDPIVRADPSRFDVNAAALREIEVLRALVERWTDVMEPSFHLAEALLTANRCAEALEVVDSVRAYVSSLEAEEKPYTDGGEFLVWILDQRSRALECLGRWDDGLAQRVRTSVLAEKGERNVSQAINLAGAYITHGRPVDALATLAKVGIPSDFGSMQIQSIRFYAALQLNDQRAIDEALAYMRAHQDDAIATYQRALVATGNLDEAAEVMIRRLESPSLRLDALIGVQDYADSAPAPFVQPWSGRGAALYERPDVQAAIERIGRIESYPSIR